MNLGAQSKLYFVAAMLFVVAAAIGFFDRGVEIKTVAGLIMASVMFALGVKARKGSSV